MTAVTIRLSDEDLSIARKLAADQGYSDTEAFLQMLVTERIHGGDSEEFEDYAAPEHLNVSSSEQLKALVREGLASPAGEMTQADFDKMRRELIDRHS